ncbi:MAG TPA: SIS domain-containing protein [Acidimicrobiales bacterium]|nr:SIS domain-containing protein [Acidimicrobiales bacterium]
MESEMAEQPATLGRLMERRSEIAQAVREVVPRDLAGTVLVARGSSDHASTCGRYLLEMATHRPVASASPSIYNLYHSTTDFSGYLVVAVSQSGRTPEITSVVEAATKAGARAVVITNDTTSPLAQAADVVVALGAGAEKAVPATKTVTAQIAAYALIAEALGGVGIDDGAAGRLPEAVAGLLADTAPAAALADWLAEHDRLVTVARGLLYGAACEVALKVEETTSRFSAAFSAADLRHGPIAIASGGLPVLAFSHPGPASEDVHELVSDLRRRGADVRLCGPAQGSALTWDADLPEAFSPVLAVVRGQQLALALARHLGRDPDAPAGLSKVTIT